MELTDEQKQIKEKALAWVFDPSQYIAIAGYAGTGKTTLMGDFVATLQNEYDHDKINLITFTGKASCVLQSKLKDFGVTTPCSTIHSLIYKLRGKNKKNELQWDLKVRDEITSSLIIVDEASMVSPQIYRDILDLNIPTIFIGDIGQLPSINGGVFQPLLDTDLKLNTVHRQALDNPIIQLATDTRNFKPIDFGVYKDQAAKVQIKSDIVKKAKQDMASDPEAIFLCGKNKTRVALNTQIRSIKGITSKHPQVGERLVCLKNDKQKMIFNGQLMFVLQCQVINEAVYYLQLQPEYEDRVVECLAYNGSFNNCKANNLDEKMSNDSKLIREAYSGYEHLGEVNFFDFGYCLSVHKSQGSEWNKVLLFDEGLPKQTKEEYYRWLYTGITRAKEKLLIASLY